jgi:hypothetical protein
MTGLFTVGASYAICQVREQREVQVQSHKVHAVRSILVNQMKNGSLNGRQPVCHSGIRGEEFGAKGILLNIGALSAATGLRGEERSLAAKSILSLAGRAPPLNDELYGPVTFGANQDIGNFHNNLFLN